MSSTTNDKVSVLMSMGFATADAERALDASGGDVERAVDCLLSSGSAGAATTTPAPASIAVPVAHAVAVPATVLPIHHHQPGTVNNEARHPSQRNRPHYPEVQCVSFRQDRRGLCYWIMNVLWLVIGGWHMFLAWFGAGLLLCLTVVCIPCGWQVIKISFFLLCPFGLSLVDAADEIEDDDVRCCSRSCNCLLNVLWAVTVGWILALQQIFTGIALCLTIVGIPFGIQCFKMSWLCFRPFGLTVSAEELVTVAVTSSGRTNYQAMPPSREAIY